MVAKDEATKIAKDFLDSNYPLKNDKYDDEYCILEEYSTENEEAWIFYYESKRFMDTGDPQYLIMLHIPLWVYKSDGKCELIYP